MISKKLRRPSLLSAAIISVTALALTACGGPSSSSLSEENQTSGKVTLWMYPVIKDETVNKKFWQDTEANFEKANPGIDLNVELQTFDKRDAQISAALAAGSGPDIVLITPDQAATYRNVRGLLPVDQAIESEKASYYPGALKAATFDGELFGVPLFQNINTTAYNTKIFADAGLPLPKTWDDIRAAAPVLAQKGIAVMDYAGSPEQTLNLSFYPLLWQAGGSVFTEDGEDIAFDSEAGRAALQFLIDMKKLGGLPADAATDASKVEGGPIATGKAAMRATTSLPELKQMRAALGAENVAFGAPLTGKKQATFGNPGLLALTTINKRENREAAYEVLSYLGSPAVQDGLTSAAGSLPTRTDAASKGQDPDAIAMAEALKSANPGEASPAARQVMGALAPNIQAALRGDLTAKEALNRAATEARGILQRAAR